MTSPPPLQPHQVLAQFVGKTINHFTDFAGIIGIIGPMVAPLSPGQALVASQAAFGSGENPYLAFTAGDIFITDLPVDASSRQLAQIGIYDARQEYVVSMGEGQLILQGVRIRWTLPKSAT